MRIDILTLFPEPVEAMLGYSILGRAREQGLVSIEVHNLRDWTTDKHRQVDDYPYGGGSGMVIKAEPICRAVEELQERTGAHRVVFLTAQGRLFTHAVAEELAAEEALILVCGHYEGVDERARQLVITDEISIGDYVLTGGELPALVVTDAVVRLQPGVVGSVASIDEDSFVEGLLEHPHYTRPRSFRGLEVPKVLLEGHHEEIRRWRRRESLRRTWERRPDLLEQADLTDEDRGFLKQLQAERDGS
ncbi:MAG: tRNA (guanosine(37)-N1)-methyltransferase TrmD [Candidatus Zipacnadales bacterium]